MTDPEISTNSHTRHMRKTKFYPLRLRYNERYNGPVLVRYEVLITRSILHKLLQVFVVSIIGLLVVIIDTAPVTV